MKQPFILLLALLAGCGPFWVDPYITVQESPLNWVEIHYYKTDKEPVKRRSVYLNGGGYVEVKKGTGSLISNDFAKDFDQWHGIKSQRLQVDPKHIQDILQNLVNYGLLDREKNFKRAKKKKEYKRFIAVKANVSNYTYSDNVNIFEADPDLAEQLLDVINEFEIPGM